VILGTGCGGGLVIDGALIDGPRGIGGEWGHNPLPWAGAGEHPGPACWCGRTGCMETWVSGPRPEADHARAVERALRAKRSRRALQAGRGSQGNARPASRRLARGLAHVINIFDPHVVVLGGGLSNLSHLYESLPDRIGAHLFAAHPRIAIRRPRWGDASGVRGAAWLWGKP
jgi:fructokinase